MRLDAQFLAFSLLKLSAGLKYDYVIVGAGPSGLVMANRLSEDPLTTVAVIEAGQDERENPLVRIPDQFPFALTSPLNWNYTTVPQGNLNNRTATVNSGRAWGGTTCINGMTYIRANREEIDAWEQLGNHGWNWNYLLPYYKKSEKYTRPSESKIKAGATYQIVNRGLNGYVRVGYRPQLVNTSTAPLMISTWEKMSVFLNPDMNSGNTRGVAIAPQTVNPENDDRWDAATAYLYPILDRPNLTIIQGTVRKIIWNQENSGASSCSTGIVASGVEFLTPIGSVEVVEAGEIILSAGALRTPGILEASGVGNTKYLDSIGIATKINLPGVGANYQEETTHFATFSGNLEPVSGAYTGYVTASQVFGDEAAQVETETRNQIQTWAEKIVESSKPSSLTIANVKSLLLIQHDLIFRQQVPIGEILTVSAPGGVVASSYWALHPFSRGSVHLSPNAMDSPLIDPAFFHIDFDMDVTVALGRFMQRFWRTTPIEEFIRGQLDPTPEVLPLNATYEQWASWTRAFGTPSAHPYGTASMMSREFGGVVDPDLRVYGTRNVRVVDGSILPMKISGHPTATLYAVAERAADILKRLQTSSG